MNAGYEATLLGKITSVVRASTVSRLAAAKELFSIRKWSDMYSVLRSLTIFHSSQGFKPYSKRLWSNRFIQTKIKPTSQGSGFTI
jgi:hypothetical protein